MPKSGNVWPVADDGQGSAKGSSAPKGALGDLVKAETMIQLGITLPAACLIGWLIGTWLDKQFGVTWISIVGVLLGAAAGFIQIFMTASRYLKRGD